MSLLDWWYVSATNVTSATLFRLTELLLQQYYMVLRNSIDVQLQRKLNRVPQSMLVC